MFDRWRYPAACAASVAIGFPALAAAAGTDEGGAGAADPPAGANGGGAPRGAKVGDPQDAAESRHWGANVLTRPVRRLHRTIDLQVRRIRAAERRQREETFAGLPAGVSQATLDAIASCESGGDPTAVSADGTYRGKYQFDYGTWASVGGGGDPAAAPEAEQDYRAALLYAQSGSSAWPNCA